MTTKRPGQPGSDLHTYREGCLPAAGFAGFRLMNGPLYVKPETYPCDGHGVPTSGRIARLGYLMTYWVVEFGSDFRSGPYRTRSDTERALSAVPA